MGLEFLYHTWLVCRFVKNVKHFQEKQKQAGAELCQAQLKFRFEV